MFLVPLSTILYRAHIVCIRKVSSYSASKWKGY
nr:MAG TPA: hypothetical protein [Caudoviricetes sp.]